MTREEAIEKLESMRQKVDEETYRALILAIKALENHDTFMKYSYSLGKHDALSQEPCTAENMIRKTAVMEVIKAHMDGEDKNTKAVLSDVMDSVNELEAFEQEPCDDTISRSDMLDAIGHGTTYTSEELQKIIQNLPSVNPKPCDDAISRKSILKYIDDWWSDSRDDIEDLIIYITYLPSVTQKSDEQLYKNGFADGYEQGHKDAEPKSGKWLYKEITDDYRVTGQCSECKERRIIDNYCPNCGAKMVEPQESEDKE